MKSGKAGARETSRVPVLFTALEPQLGTKNQQNPVANLDKAITCGRPLKEGGFVALLDGNIIAVADNPDDAISALRATEPDPKRGMVIEVSQPVVDVIR